MSTRGRRCHASWSRATRPTGGSQMRCIRSSPSRLGIVVAIVVWALPMGPSAQAQLPEEYGYSTVKTVYGGDGPCTVQRSVTVPVGTPVPVDAGGTPDPDLIVHLGAVPPPAGDGTATLSIERLTVEPIRVSVSVSVESLSVGYDACASGAPSSFRANALTSGDAITVGVDT